MGKILFLTLEFPPDVGGVGRMYRELCRAMPPGRIIVWAPPVSNDSSPASSLDTYLVKRQDVLSRWGWPRWLTTIFLLDSYLRNQGLNELIVGQILPLGTVAWLLGLVRPIRYAVFVHGLDISQPLQSRRKRWLLKRILHRAEWVFAANQFVAGLIRGLNIPSPRIKIIYPAPVLTNFPNAALTERLRREYTLANEPVLLTIGRLVERKGHDVVLRALERVWLVIPQLRYYIIGSGPARTRLKVLAATLSKPQQVKFLGEVNDDEAAAWLNLATIFIMTPRTLPNGDVEGLGTVYLEAGYFGKPVIGSRSGGVVEAIVDQETGLLVPENDVEATAEAILKLLKNPELAARLGAAGQARVQRDFSASQGANVILAAFDSDHQMNPVRNPRGAFKSPRELFLCGGIISNGINMISVIIPAFNHGWALPACLNSLEAQTFQDFEIIIVDDGSTDDTETIVKEYIRSHQEESRIRYLKIDHCGAPTARNTGASQSRGQFLIFVDADLILKADMLQKLQTTLANHPEASYVYSSFRFGWKKFLSRPFNAAALRENNYIHTTALIRREHFTGFDEQLARFQDWDLWLTMLEQDHIGVFLAEELFVARVGQVGISRWRPRLWYRLWAVSARWTGLAPASWQKFMAAKNIVQRKHNLL